MMIKRGISQVIDAIEGQIFDVSVPIPGGHGQERELEGTLLPPLGDKLVIARIWPLLHERVNVSLLWRLRRVNRAWKEMVGTTLEWAALEMVRLDSPGYLRTLAERHQRRPPLQDRVRCELNAFTILLAESLDRFSVHADMAQSRIRSVGPVVGEIGRGLVDTRTEESEISDTSDCSCSRKRAAQHSDCIDHWSSEFEGCEEEEVSAYASSTDGSLRVYYPRHAMRVR